MKINLNNEHEAAMNNEWSRVGDESFTDKDIENVAVNNIKLLNRVRDLEKKLDRARAIVFNDEDGDLDFIKFKWQNEIDPEK